LKSNGFQLEFVNTGLISFVIANENKVNLELIAKYMILRPLDGMVIGTQAICGFHLILGGLKIEKVGYRQ